VTPPDLRTVIGSSRVVICCGSGGVGKTTVAAAMGIAAALLGRRACVITVDPARRLADALAVGSLANTPEPIEGSWTGSLDAMALDAKATFDDLVRGHAPDPEQAERILTNRLYQNLVTTLSGTQEYMATEKLHELLEEGRYDVVVVDTPPSRNALDFLAAPERLAGFLDNRVMRMLLAPARSGLRVAGLASELVLRNLGRVAGKAIVEDTIGFFRAFAGMEEGFRRRADAVRQVLDSDESSFVLVASPRLDAISEADFFAEAIAGRGLGVAAVIVNRVHPDFGPPVQSAAGSTLADAPWDALARNLAEMAAIVANEAQTIEEIGRRFAPTPVTRLPLAASDIHDLSALDDLARRMLSGTIR
jgi:anion-transporting  ArsA/GET3 family ATPase